MKTVITPSFLKFLDPNSEIDIHLIMNYFN